MFSVVPVETGSGNVQQNLIPLRIVSNHPRRSPWAARGVVRISIARYGQKGLEVWPGDGWARNEGRVGGGNGLRVDGRGILAAGHRTRALLVNQLDDGLNGV